MVGVFPHVYLMLIYLFFVYVRLLLYMLTMCLWLFVVVGLALVLVALTDRKYICVCLCALQRESEVRVGCVYRAESANVVTVFGCCRGRRAEGGGGLLYLPCRLVCVARLLPV